jgi:hypothetical protein
MPNSADNKPSTRPCSPISIQWNEMQVCTAASAHGKIYIASRIAAILRTDGVDGLIAALNRKADMLERNRSRGHAARGVI